MAEQSPPFVLATGSHSAALFRETVASLLAELPARASNAARGKRIAALQRRARLVVAEGP